jgi:hypothetical protein
LVLNATVGKLEHRNDVGIIVIPILTRAGLFSPNFRILRFRQNEHEVQDVHSRSPRTSAAR